MFQMSILPEIMSKSNNTSKKDNKSTGILTPSLLCEIKQLHRFAQEADLFMNDRELLRCNNCGLLEDVDITGRLITYKSGDPVSDSGMKFEKGEGDTYVCPICGAAACEG
jgi:rubrerythrin